MQNLVLRGSCYKIRIGPRIWVAICCQQKSVEVGPLASRAAQRIYSNCIEYVKIIISSLTLLCCLLGWWFVNVDEEQGWVPAAYLEKEDGTTEEVTSQSELAGNRVH